MSIENADEGHLQSQTHERYDQEQCLCRIKNMKRNRHTSVENKWTNGGNDLCVASRAPMRNEEPSISIFGVHPFWRPSDIKTLNPSKLISLQRLDASASPITWDPSSGIPATGSRCFGNRKSEIGWHPVDYKLCNRLRLLFLQI